ncbi:uncharacterized protein [Amphiura filiformis]|uniref:uncharacterized protein n=1 Tax=Amphiura filiformis TaxID=82378 RepID=UPI003B21CFA2
MSRKRDLSPDSQNNERPYQQQKSISDVIGPILDQCHVDIEHNQSLASLASQNAAAKQDKSSIARPTETSTSAGSSRQNSSEGEGFNSLDLDQEINPDEDAGEDGYTDADGRLGDAVKAVGKKGKKVAISVADDIETVVGATVDILGGVVKDMAEDIEDTVEGGLDLIGDVVNVPTGVMKSCISTQHSVEEKPSNNVYISHPTEGAAKMVPMGLHIQPVTFKKGSGQMVRMVEPGKLAEQAHLEEGDVIIAIDTTDVQNATLEEALHIFGTISSTFSMTIIRRIHPIAGIDIPILTKKTITVEVHINEENTVAIKILEIRCERLTYVRDNTLTDMRIAHQTPELQRYMRVTDDGMLVMHPQDTNGCQFKLNPYTPACQPVGGGYYACPFTVTCTVTRENTTSEKALEIKTDDANIHQAALGLTETDGLTSDGLLEPDNRYFLLHFPWGGIANGSDMLLESSTMKGHFLAVESGELKIRQNAYTSESDLVNGTDSKFRFKLVPPAPTQQESSS